MKKLTFLFIIFFILISYSQSNEENKLNFIIVFVDDMGYGDIGSYGHPTIKTPNLDRMSYEGQKWTQFYSASSVCTPSRAALMTGRLPIRNGMIGEKYRVLYENSDYGIPESEITIAEKLKEQNYKTAAIGKWHLGHKQKYLPLNNGFDYYYGIPYSNDMNAINGVTCCPGNNYWPQYENNPINSNNYNLPLIENNDIIERPVDQTTITKRFSEKVVEKIKEMKDDKFFIYLSHSMPHIPIYASDDFIGKSKAGLYGDVIEEIDHGVGIIMNELRKNDLDKNTIVVFSSDNGPWLPYKNHGGSAGLLREGKGMTWEGGHRVPGIFWGGDIKPGVIDEIGSTMDLFPTFLDLSNSSKVVDRVIDGVNIKETLFDHAPSKRNKIIFYREREIYAIRYGEYKAHFIIKGAYNYPKGSNKKIVLEEPLLFNLNIDPSEKHNIADKFPEKVEEIKKIAIDHLNSFEPPESVLDYRNSKEF
ncbi:MAG: arylsulfatase [Flavobacteriaceae bacterium]|nr:arylsulfatase [Flavobacteriaceae bacterium]